ncbi:MAG: CoA transferase [Acidobacteria bacterium]|nr:CoA transferase [Acidobacteriota bacterium]
MLPLQGIRVLDFGRYIAGPYCAMLLADFGADVIRIERLEGGEDRYLAPVTDTGEGPLFLALNRNKRGLALDLGQPQAREIQRRLIATADVVIANLPLDVLTKLELDYASLTALKPDIILAQLSAFGADGPYATRAGFDPVAQAMSGAMNVTGFPGPPIRSVVNYADYGTALHAAFGVMVALYERRTTGRGQVVEASLLTTGVTFMQALLAERAAIGAVREQQGNTGYHAAPADTYQTQDGWIIIQAIGQPMFKRWARLVNRPELIDDPRCTDDLTRANHHDVINAAMNEWTSQHTNASALAALEAARIPAAPVYDFDQTLNDPHIRARGLLRPMAYPDGAKPTLLADTAVRLSATPASVRHRAPRCGEHSQAILLELGYATEEIAQLKEAGVIR